MKVNLWTSQGVVAVVDDVSPFARRVHKYAVLEDARRTDPMWGTHCTASDLDGVVVEHSQTTTICHGCVTSISWEPDPDASREIVERGGSVQLDEETEPRGITA